MYSVTLFPKFRFTLVLTENMGDRLLERKQEASSELALDVSIVVSQHCPQAQLQTLL